MNLIISYCATQVEGEKVVNEPPADKPPSLATNQEEKALQHKIVLEKIPQRNKNGNGNGKNGHGKDGKLPKTLGPVLNLEEHVPADWWRKIFNALYLKTDADVVDDQGITRHEIDMFWNILQLSSESKILDLCCGQGRHSLELARRGCKYTEGLDRSDYLIQKAKGSAKKENLPVKFREGDARKLSYPPDTFDVVMILGNSFGYFANIEDDLRVLKEVSRILKPGGQLLIDVTDGEHVRTSFQPRSWEWIGKKQFVCRERSLSKDCQRLISREVITDVEKGVIADQFYAERLYSKESLGKLMEEAGLSNCTFHGGFSPDSQRNQDLGMMERRIILTASISKEWTVRKRKVPNRVNKLAESVR
jgi:D-alanine-D-alanine ligase